MHCQARNPGNAREALFARSSAPAAHRFSRNRTLSAPVRAVHRSVAPLMPGIYSPRPPLDQTTEEVFYSILGFRNNRTRALTMGAHFLISNLVRAGPPSQSRPATHHQSRLPAARLLPSEIQL